MARQLFSLILTLLIIPSLAASILPKESETLLGYERDSVIRRMKQLPLHHIEGLWQFTANGATIAIERYIDNNTPHDGASRYRIVIVSSPRLSIRPGTVMGIMIPTAKPNVYDAHIYTDFDGGTTLTGAKRFVLTLSEDSRLAFNQDKSGIKINLWRILPYMFRYSVTYKNERPRNLDGCVRIYPTPSTPLQPRYL